MSFGKVCPLSLEGRGCREATGEGDGSQRVTAGDGFPLSRPSGTLPLRGGG
jgi:hypothetical protein